MSFFAFFQSYRCFFRLYQAEEKYERRESRPEDLDAINQLKALVRDREEQMQKLIVSYYENC